MNSLVLRLQLLEPLPSGNHTVGVLTKKKGKGDVRREVGGKGKAQ
jgi:hypothetical protein